MDRVFLEGMSFFGRHGVHPAERELGARFVVDVELALDLAPAAVSGRIEDTVDYAQVHRVVREVVEGEPQALIESVAGAVADILLSLDRVETVTVRVRKQLALEGGPFHSIGVELSRRRA